jgi:hypothetical protein
MHVNTINGRNEHQIEMLASLGTGHDAHPLPCSLRWRPHAIRRRASTAAPAASWIEHRSTARARPGLKVNHS